MWQDSKWTVTEHDVAHSARLAINSAAPVSTTRTYAYMMHRIQNLYWHIVTVQLTVHDIDQLQCPVVEDRKWVRDKSGYMHKDLAN